MTFESSKLLKVFLCCYPIVLTLLCFRLTSRMSLQNKVVIASEDCMNEQPDKIIITFKMLLQMSVTLDTHTNS